MPISSSNQSRAPQTRRPLRSGSRYPEGKLFLLAVISILIGFVLACCAPSGIAEQSAFTLFRSERGEAQAVVYLLPGAGGVEIEGDTPHYEGVARQLAATCRDVVIVDYAQAYRNAGRPDLGSRSDRFRWAIASAQTWYHATVSHPAANWAVIGWSLGGQGALIAAASGFGANAPTAVVAYYPVAPETPGRIAVPTLILTGANDTITPPDGIEAHAQGQTLVRLVVYPNAEHGFDVANLDRPRTVRFPPLVGPAHRLAYAPEIAAQSWSEVESFLSNSRLGAC